MKVDNNKNKLSGFRSAIFIPKGIPIAWWPVIATLLVQFHMLRNPIFMYDDLVHLYNVSNLPFIDAIRITMGGHLIHSLTTVFWVLKSLFGVNPVAFMLVGITIHLVSVRLLFEIISRLTARNSLAALGASVWGMNPFIAASLEWISVHGQVYATAAVLWVLLDIVRYGQTPSLLKNGLLIRHAFLLLVAATSFGSGLSSTVVFVLVIAVWNPLPDRRNRLLAVYGSVALLAIALYAFTMSTEAEGGYAGTNATGATIMYGVGNIPGVLGAFLGLLCVGSSGLLWGPLIIGKISLVPRDSLAFVATIAAVLVTLPLLIWGCMLSNPSERRRIFALLLLPCAAYGLIAVARTSFMAQVLVVTPRYHYLSIAIIAIVVCLVLAKLIDRLPHSLLNYGRASFAIWLAIVILPFALAPAEGVKAIGKLNQENQYNAAMREIQAALKNNADQHTIFIVNKPYRVTPVPMRIIPEYFPGFAALFVLSYPSNSVDGKRVLFLEASNEIVEMTKAQKGSRISELLVYEPNLAR